MLCIMPLSTAQHHSEDSSHQPEFNRLCVGTPTNLKRPQIDFMITIGKATDIRVTEVPERNRYFKPRCANSEMHDSISIATCDRGNKIVLLSWKGRVV